MDKTRMLYWVQEGVWALFIVLLYAVVCYPMYQGIEYKFYGVTFAFVALPVYYLHLILSFRRQFWLQHKWVKLGLFLLNFHFWIAMLDRYQLLMRYWDYNDIQYFAHGLKNAQSLSQQAQLLDYLYQVLVLGGTASLVMIILMNCRIIMSYFQKNLHRLYGK